MTYKISKIGLNYIKSVSAGTLISLILSLISAVPAQATVLLAISNITASPTEASALIGWTTNRSATGRVEWGTTAGTHTGSTSQLEARDHQSVAISGLLPQTLYYYKITASDSTGTVSSFERSFTTSRGETGSAPVISDVRVAYVTGTTLTVQWRTNEAATTIVEFGKTESYGSTRSDGSFVTVHDITITGLTPGALYHFRVKSKDRDNLTATDSDLNVRLLPTETSDREPLTIYAIQPSSQNADGLAATTANISWRTNKLASGKVRYGTTDRYGITRDADAPRAFEHQVYLSGLQPNTSYFFEIEARDVFGKISKISRLTFTTKPGSTGSTTGNGSQTGSTGSISGAAGGQVLGSSTCNVDLDTDFGYYGLYYNLSEGHPDVELFRGQDVSWTKIARQNDWYDAKYFAFARIDPKLTFGGNFLPVRQSKPGDPFHFAVNWRAAIEVPADSTYSFEITSDDDSWLFIDDRLISDLGGVHRAKTNKGLVSLSPGYHKLEIYYAERSRGSAVFSFTLDPQIKVHPLPEGCELSDLFNVPSGGTGRQRPAGQVLGASAGDYTPAVAIYKTADSPDIWAILVNGHRHYITSPAAFDRYGYRWADVRTVSRAKLESYPIQKLVRTPEDTVVYHLFTRPDHQWIKIPISTPTVFISYPDNYWGNVAVVDLLDISRYPDAEFAQTSAGAAIYGLEGNVRRRFASYDAFRQNGYNPAEIVTINITHLDSYTDGPVIE